MAQRQVIEHVNQENITSRLTAKSAIVQPLKSKRPAFADLGNKAPSLSTNNNATTKGAMGPPQVIKKVVTSFPAKKEVPKKVLTKPESKVAVKREESIIKHIRVDCKKLDSSKSKVSYSSNIINPDESSKNEPQMVTEYLGDIFNYLRELENQYPIEKNFLEDHKTSPRMRAILVNWLAEVHINFKLYLETLHLGIAIVDRYLQINKSIGRDTLQLVGTAAMYIASKYEEMYIQSLEDFVYICDDTFTKRQILQMEIEILKKLDFNLGRPLSIHFLRRYNKIAQARNDHHTLGKYILELALLQHEMSPIKPSIQAAAACCLSIAVLDNIMDLPKIWTPTLVHYTTYVYSDFKSVIIDFAHLIVKSETSKYQTIRKKYAASSYSKISINSKLNGPLIKKLTSTKKLIAST